LIADEPLTMLDASQRLNILALLLQLKVKRNLTILLITHDLASAKMMSERTMVMYLGRVVETGPTENVLSKPLHPYSEMILTATPQLKQGQKVYSQFVEASKESWLVTKGCVFAPRCKYATNICLEQEPVLIERNRSQFAACHNPLNVTK
jgi:oligopeptide/dipeptide ABC transporter ATP-binding protein